MVLICVGKKLSVVGSFAAVFKNVTPALNKDILEWVMCARSIIQSVQKFTLLTN
jgi:hypothetical protein